MEGFWVYGLFGRGAFGYTGFWVYGLFGSHPIYSSALDAIAANFM
jgi:hypothetical protein